jgi:hypothetical protein
MEAALHPFRTNDVLIDGLPRRANPKLDQPRPRRALAPSWVVAELTARRVRR